MGLYGRRGGARTPTPPPERKSPVPPRLKRGAPHVNQPEIVKNRPIYGGSGTDHRRLDKFYFANTDPQAPHLNDAGLAFVHKSVASGQLLPDVWLALGLTRQQWSQLRRNQPPLLATLANARKTKFKALTTPSQGALCKIDPTTGGAVAVSEAGLEVIIKICSQGLGKRVQAHALGVTPHTFKTLVDTDPALAAAIEAGSSQYHQRIMGDLNRMSGANNVAASIFLAKSVLGLKENDSPQSGQTNVQIIVNEALSPDEWRKKREQRITVTTQPPVPDE